MLNHVYNIRIKREKKKKKREKEVSGDVFILSDLWTKGLWVFANAVKMWKTPMFLMVSLIIQIC